MSLALGVEEAVLAAQPEPSLMRVVQMVVWAHASSENTLRGPVEKSGWVKIQDLAGKAHLRVDQCVPWAVALQILELLSDM